MKTSSPKSPSEIESTDDAHDATLLDAPLTNRGFFLGVSYLTQAIESEGYLLRDEVKCDTPGELLASRASAYRGLCREYLRALHAPLKSEHDELIKKFNESLS